MSDEFSYYEDVLPILGELQQQVLRGMIPLVRKYGPRTATEIQEGIGMKHRDCVTNRLNELRRAGLVRKRGKKVCTGAGRGEHGRTITAWDLVRGKPRPISEEEWKLHIMDGGVRTVLTNGKKAYGFRSVLATNLNAADAGDLDKFIHWVRERLSRRLEDPPHWLPRVVDALDQGKLLTGYDHPLWDE